MILASKTPKFKISRFTSAEWVMIKYVCEKAVENLQDKIMEVMDQIIEEPSILQMSYKQVFEKDWKYEIMGEGTSYDGKSRKVKFLFSFKDGAGFNDNDLVYTRHSAGGVQRTFSDPSRPIEIESFINDALPLDYLLKHAGELDASFRLNIGHEFNHYKNPYRLTREEQKIQSQMSEYQRNGKPTPPKLWSAYLNSPSEYESRLNQIITQMSYENEKGDNILRRHWEILDPSQKMDYVLELLKRNEEWHISAKDWTEEHRKRVYRTVMWFLDGGELSYDRIQKQVGSKGDPGMPNIRLRGKPRKNVNRKTRRKLPYSIDDLASGDFYPSKDGKPTPFRVFSDKFAEEDTIPVRYTCKGDNVSPNISWRGMPEGVASIALIMNDSDAGDWLHWAVWDLPTSAAGIPEGYGDPKNPSESGIKQGRNDSGTRGYSGPCPPEGIHSYVFTVYALDSMLDLDEGVGKSELLAAIKEHEIGSASMTAFFGLKKKKEELD